MLESEVVRRFTVEGVKVADLAEEAGCSRPTIYTILHRAGVPLVRQLGVSRGVIYGIINLGRYPNARDKTIAFLRHGPVRKKRESA